MKIVSWNCNGAFRKKYKKILELDADIYVIQECEPLNEIKGELKKLISDGIWEKGANRKGVLVFAKPDVKLEKMEWDSFGMRVFIPIMINDSFPLIAVWTTKPAYIEEFYIWQLVNSGRINEDVVIIGDFNSIITALIRANGSHRYEFVGTEWLNPQSDSVIILSAKAVLLE